MDFEALGCYDTSGEYPSKQESTDFPMPKKDLRHISAVCQRYRHLGMTKAKELAFRNWLHKCKDRGDRGSDNGDYTDEEVEALVREFLKLD